ncbi:MAG: hypothetical protein IPJ33_00010 [Gammaproteobacteria bacterium]|nr:hypothetical protein [Gammaproteobacteria bacterium]
MKQLAFNLRLAAALFVGLIPLQAFAYVGPGAGLSAIGSILALIAAFFLALVGFIWYPLKRLLRKGKKQDIEASGGASEPADTLPAEAKPRTQHDS